MVPNDMQAKFGPDRLQTERVSRTKPFLQAWQEEAWPLVIGPSSLLKKKNQSCRIRLKIGRRSPMVQSDVHAKFGADRQRNKKVYQTV